MGRQPLTPLTSDFLRYIFYCKGQTNARVKTAEGGLNGCTETGQGADTRLLPDSDPFLGGAILTGR